MLELTKTYLLFQFRNRQIFVGTMFFSIFLVFLFTLAFPSTDPEQYSLYSGIFWISSFFAGNLVLTNQSQLQTGKFQQGILLTGIDSFQLFFAKCISSFIYMFFIQIVVLFCMSFFFPIPPHFLSRELFSSIALGTLGFVSVGTLAYSLIEFQNVKDLLVTILFYPIVIPLFLFAHKSTTMILANQSSRSTWILVGYDLIFVFLSALLYEFIIEDNI